MVHSFIGIPTKAFTRIAIREDGTDRPSPGKLERIDSIMASFGGGHAWRFALAADEQHTDSYEYGYLIYGGRSIDRHKLESLEEELQEAGVDSPWVRAESLWVDGEQLDRMEFVGRDPEEALAALSGLRDAVEDRMDDDDDPPTLG
jgi:hypothetical protein